LKEKNQVRIFSSACPGRSPGNPDRINHSVYIVYIIAFVSCLLTSCAHFGLASPSKAPSETAEVSAHDKKYLGAEYLLLTLEAFSKADAIGKAGIYEAASTAAVLEPTAIHRLILALLKSIPGHHGYHLDSAQQLLKAVLWNPGDLPPGAAYLAGVYLDAISEQRRLNSQIVLLKAELAEAQKKLEALTEIEREVESPPQDVNGEPLLAPDDDSKPASGL
jgi:hypothetical protein